MKNEPFLFEFLISLSIFGLFFKMIQADSLFVMNIAPNQERITSIDQLVLTNTPIYADLYSIAVAY